MRKILLSLVLLVAAVIGYGVAASALRARVTEAVPRVAATLSEKLGVRIEHGDVSVSYLPLAARIRDVRVAGKPAATQPFLQVDALDVRARWLPLLLGRVEVGEIVADAPRLEMIRDPRDARESTVVPERILTALADVPFVLTVRAGSVLYEDRGAEPAARLRASSLDGTVRGGAEGALEATLEGAALSEHSTAKLVLRLLPKVGPTGGDEVKLEVDVDDASAAALPEGFIMLRGAELRDPLRFSLRAQGLLGERSTETKPAEPLVGKLQGSVGVVIAGLEDRLELDADVALDDSRYQLRGGTGTWGGLRFVPTGWISRLVPRKVSGRMDLDAFDLEEMAERLGVPERWRPRGRADLTLRVLGSSIEPLYRYEGTLSDAAFSPWPSLAIKAGPTRVHGTLIAVNADATASFNTKDLQVGTARIPEFLFGVSYWREKLTVSALESPAYDGRIDGSAAFFPKVSADPLGGMLVRDVDGEKAIANVLPRLPFGVNGRLDAAVQLITDEHGTRARGRIGIHRGRIDGANWTRSLVEAALAQARAAHAAGEVIAAHRPLLGADVTRFERMAIDFETDGGVVTLPRVVADMAGASLRGRGEIAADGGVTLTAALWPDASLAASLASAAPAFSRARDAEGRPVLPCEVRAGAGRLDVRPADELRRALSATGDVPPLAPIRVGPADFGELVRLRKQFGR